MSKLCKEVEASEPPKPAPVTVIFNSLLGNEQACQESFPEKQESQAESLASAKEIPVNELKFLRSLIDLPQNKPWPSADIRLDNYDPIKDNSLAFKSNGGNGESSATVKEAWEMLKKSYVHYKENEVGTLADMDPGAEDLKYNQGPFRSFISSCLVSMMKVPPQPHITKNFLLKTVHHQDWEERIGNFTLGEGVMPTSFKVPFDSHCQKETLVADFGGSARNASTDTGFWWIILLRSYIECTGENALVDDPAVQRVIKLIPTLCLLDSKESLTSADECSMIDRRMDIYGYPIEIQALALRCAKQMLEPEGDGNLLIDKINHWITAYRFHVQLATMERESSKASGSSKNASPKSEDQSPIFKRVTVPEILSPYPISKFSEIDAFLMGHKAPEQPKRPKRSYD